MLQAIRTMIRRQNTSSKIMNVGPVCVCVFCKNCGPVGRSQNDFLIACNSTQSNCDNFLVSGRVLLCYSEKCPFVLSTEIAGWCNHLIVTL